MGCAHSKEAGQEFQVSDAGGVSKNVAKASPTSPLECGGDCDASLAGTDSEAAAVNETQRLQALLDCKLLDTPDERRFDAITALLKEMFQTPIALVSLIDRDRLWFKSVAGVDGRAGSRLHSFCDASLRAPNPTMMVVPDTLKDSRFQTSQFVAGPPYVRFYAGAPLISSEGQVMGSLGVLDVRPRAFPAGGQGSMSVACVVLGQRCGKPATSEVLEQQQRKKVDAALTARKNTVRALSCFDEAVLLCDTGACNWPILYVNEQWCRITGISEPSCLHSGLWDLFRQMPGEGPAGLGPEVQQAIAESRPFAATLTGGECDQLTLEFRPASCDHLSSACPRIGVPNFVEGLGTPDHEPPPSLYFAVVKSAEGPQQQQRQKERGGLQLPSGGKAGAQAKRSSVDTCPNSGSSTKTPLSSSAAYSLLSFGQDCPDSLKEVRLGPLLGRGSYGLVHRGQWKGVGVAVKIIDSWVDPASPDGCTAAVLEAVLSKSLAHPNIVQTFEYAIKQDDPSAVDTFNQAFFGSGSDGSDDKAGGNPGKQHCQVWIMQEYCNHGTLGDAIDRGWLRQRCAMDGPPNMLAVLATALEVAAAMKYLHHHSVLHGDLHGGNVLLSGTRHSGRRDSRSFKAKVADFGLARVMEGKQQQTGTYGTISHMPLELIQGGVATTAVDVFSFGTLLWEMYCSERAFAQRNPMQVLHTRTVLKQRLALPEGCPPQFKRLVESCLDEKHEARPTFDEIVATLDAILEQELEAAGQATAGSTAPTSPTSPAPATPTV